MRVLLALAWLCLCTQPLRAATEITVGLLAFPLSLGNPHMGLNLPLTMANDALYDTLTRLDHDGAVQPWLATDWQRTDPTTWRFSLREDVSFSNGEPFDARTVVDALEYLRTPEGSATSLGSDLRRITGAREIDPFTVAIETEAPHVLLPLYLSRLFLPAPEHWAALGSVGFSQDPVGTGPFQVKSWEQSVIEMEAHRTSWRAPEVDRLTFRKLPDATARLQGLLSGAVDIAFNLGPDDRATIEAAGHQFYVRLDPHHVYISFITENESPVQSEAVRIALNYAVDRRAITDIIMAGATQPSNQPTIRPAFGYNPEVPDWPYDPALAKQMLSDAGYPEGFEMTIAMVPGNGGNSELAVQKVAQDLAAVGVRVTLQPITLPRLVRYIYEGGWDADAFDMFGSGYDPLRTYRLKSCRWQTPYYCDETIMPMLDAAETAPDIVSRRQLTQALMAYERDHPASIQLYRRPGFDGIAARVTGYEVIADVIPFHALGVSP